MKDLSQAVKNRKANRKDLYDSSSYYCGLLSRQEQLVSLIFNI